MYWWGQLDSTAQYRSSTLFSKGHNEVPFDSKFAAITHPLRSITKGHLRHQVAISIALPAKNQAPKWDLPLALLRCSLHSSAAASFFWKRFTGRAVRFPQLIRGVATRKMPGVLVLEAQKAAFWGLHMVPWRLMHGALRKVALLALSSNDRTSLRA